MATPKTDIIMNHQHHYSIDAKGNGRTSTVCHPQNPTICHNHEIRNFDVHQAPSTCYPNCTGIGAPGLANHHHNINIPASANLSTISGRRFERRGPQGTARKVIVNARRSKVGGY